MQLTNPKVTPIGNQLAMVEIDCTDCKQHYSCVVPVASIAARNSGASVQSAFPMLTAAQRELFFMTGICGDCWKKMTEAWEEE